MSVSQKRSRTSPPPTDEVSQKRARTSPPPTEKSPADTIPAIPLTDIALLTPAECHKLILDLANLSPSAATLVISRIDVEKAKRKAAADHKAEVDRRQAMRTDFNMSAEQVAEALNERPYSGQDRVEMARDIDEFIEEQVKEIILGSEHSPEYTKRVSAISAIMDMARSVWECPYESVADELNSDYTLEEGFEKICELAKAKGEGEKLRGDIMAKAKEINGLYPTGKGFNTGKYVKLAEGVLGGGEAKDK